MFGTSSIQGKFTLQILLKHLLEKAGYKVSTIGTEPHSLLFGMDYIFHLGYNSNILIDGHSTITVLNNMIYNLCNNNEIIITGSQSNTIPTSFMNISAYPLRQHSFLLGVQPDAVILCVNPYDDIEYVINTIKYLEGTTNCKVISIVVFPMQIQDDWRAVFDIKTKITDEEFKCYHLQYINTQNCQYMRWEM